MSSRLRLLACLALLLTAVACGERQTLDAPARLLWVTRWDYRTAEDLKLLVERADEAGFDELLLQVRGNATCFFESSYEPWAEQFGFEDPGFDPLAVGLDAARARGLKLHAWVNVVPAWWGATPPTDPGHVLNAHPEWLWFDDEGRRQPFEERFYVSLNPCLPEVREHIGAVLGELLERYAVDGLHLDYIRFPNELTDGEGGADYPRDDRTTALFREQRGASPSAAPEAWNEWRAEQVTQLVRELREVQQRTRPNAIVSAAVGADAIGASRHFQDWPTWIEEGLVDALIPMNYSGDDLRYEELCEAWGARAEQVRVVMGIHAESAQPQVVRARMRDALERFGGYSLFGYLSLWDSANDVIDVQSSERSEERAQLRSSLLPLAD